MSWVGGGGVKVGVYLCVVCLVWSLGGGGRSLLAVPPGDWSAPPPAAVTPPSRQTGSRQGTGEEVPTTSRRGCTGPSTFWRRMRGSQEGGEESRGEETRREREDPYG